MAFRKELYFWGCILPISKNFKSTYFTLDILAGGVAKILRPKSTKHFERKLGDMTCVPNLFSLRT